MTPILDSDDASQRRVLLLETDERGGLVAAVAAACHAEGISLEITTGLSHVLLTFAAGDARAEAAATALRAVPGVASVRVYDVAPMPPPAAAAYA